MKMNIKGNSHYPVEVLLDKITETLIKLVTQYEFNNAFTKSLNNKIKFLLSDNLIRDVGELDTQNQIKIYDNFCQFFWCLWLIYDTFALIFTSHNANLFVNSDAELVVCCDNKEIR